MGTRCFSIIRTARSPPSSGSHGFDPDEKYYDPKSDPDNPRWCLVDLEYVSKLDRPITLAELKSEPGLDGMVLTRRGNRLSIMPVSEEHWELILSLE